VISQADHKYFYLFLVFAVILTLLLSMQYVKSQQLRQEMIDSQNQSYYITNASCGYNLSGNREHTGCPAPLECVSIEKGATKCLKPGFKEDFCGNHSGIGIQQSKPPEIECGFKHSFEDEIKDWLAPIGLVSEAIHRIRITILDPPDLAPR